MNPYENNTGKSPQESLDQAKRRKAMEWWNSLASLRKTQLCDTNTDLVGFVRRWETLTGREIQMIYELLHSTTNEA